MSCCVQIAGAGSAGIGVASMLLQGMVEQGMARNKAARSFWVCDKDGLLTMARGDVSQPSATARVAFLSRMLMLTHAMPRFDGSTEAVGAAKGVRA
jgi:malic enzyme